MDSSVVDRVVFKWNTLYQQSKLKLCQLNPQAEQTPAEDTTLP